MPSESTKHLPQMVQMIDDPVVSVLFDPVAEVLDKVHEFATGGVPILERSEDDQLSALAQRIDVLAALLAAHLGALPRHPSTDDFIDARFQEIREMVGIYHDVKAAGSSTVIQ